jgi:hypothetical protein
MNHQIRLFRFCYCWIHREVQGKPENEMLKTNYMRLHALRAYYWQKMELSRLVWQFYVLHNIHLKDNIGEVTSQSVAWRFKDRGSTLSTGHLCPYQNVGTNTCGCCACPFFRIYDISRTVTIGITPTIFRKIILRGCYYAKSMRAVWNYWIMKISVPNTQRSISSVEVFHVAWRKMFEIVTYSLHRI